MFKKLFRKLRPAMLALVLLGGASQARAVGETDPDTAIVDAADALSGKAKLAGAAGVAVLLVIWGIRVGKKGVSAAVG